ncbi:MAG: sensor histidine kinase [Ignavibacteriaceae bacterium]
MLQQKNKSKNKKLTGDKNRRAVKRDTVFYVLVDQNLKIIECSEGFSDFLKQKFKKVKDKLFLLNIFPEFKKIKIGTLIRETIAKNKYNHIENILSIFSERKTFSIDIYPRQKTALIFMKDISKRKRAEQSLKKSRRELRALAAHLQNIREEEIRSLSREIHDELGQKLAALKIETGLLLQKISSSGDPIKASNIAETIKSIDKLVNETLESKNLVLSKFRLDFLEELGLIEAVRMYLKEFEKRYGIKCYFDADWDYLDLDYEKSLALYRIFQESLTNISRHSNATEVDIIFEKKNQKLFMTVEDNGKGFKTPVKHSFGLGILGMEERALAIGGSFSIKGVRDKGTIIQLSTKLNSKIKDDKYLHSR